MKFESLGTLMDEIDEYDEYRPIFIDLSTPISFSSRCFIVLVDDPSLTSYSAIPDAAREEGMTRFLSSGQLMDVHGTLVFQNDFEEPEKEDLLAAITRIFEDHVKR